jgi:ribosomal protein S18 acetylase RimI-like enzyme
MSSQNAGSLDVAVCDAMLADSPAIATLVSGLGYPTTPERMWKRLASILADEDYCTLVARAGERIVGFVGVRVGPLYEDDQPYGQIMALAVAADAQRLGVGTQLIRAAELALISRGAGVSVVASGNQRAVAHAFYEKNGYTFTGRRYRKSFPSSQPSSLPQCVDLTGR